MKTKKLVLAVTLTMLSLTGIHAQVFTITEEWDAQGCLQGSQERTSSAVDLGGNLVYTSNKANSTGSNIYLSYRPKSVLASFVFHISLK